MSNYNDSICSYCENASCIGLSNHYYLCDSCQGSGGHDIGDCEDGVWAYCLDCDGSGQIVR